MSKNGEDGNHIWGDVAKKHLPRLHLTGGVTVGPSYELLEVLGHKLPLETEEGPRSKLCYSHCPESQDKESSNTTD